MSASQTGQSMPPADACVTSVYEVSAQALLSFGALFACFRSHTSILYLCSSAKREFFCRRLRFQGKKGSTAFETERIWSLHALRGRHLSKAREQLLKRERERETATTLVAPSRNGCRRSLTEDAGDLFDGPSLRLRDSLVRVGPEDDEQDCEDEENRVVQFVLRRKATGVSGRGKAAEEART